MMLVRTRIIYIFMYLFVSLNTLILFYILHFRTSNGSSPLHISAPNVNRLSLIDTTQNENSKQKQQIPVRREDGITKETNPLHISVPSVNRLAMINTAQKGSLMQKMHRPIRRKQKIITFVTKYFNYGTWPQIRMKGWEDGCNYTNCFFTADLTYRNESDALMFHASMRIDNIPSLPELKIQNQTRPHDQIWILFTRERPDATVDFNKYSNEYFNWYMSYQRNADIRIPYGSYAHIHPENETTERNYAVGKSKMVVWLVSHCDTSRDYFVKELEKYVQVDVGGTCNRRFKSQLYCKAHNCMEELKSYKFYLAAENHFCEDYITEKYYKQGFLGDTVPIVLGGADYSELAVPGSYINPFDFKNVKEFADYLKILDKDDQKYNEYFKWKQKYEIKNAETHPRCLCDLCVKLHQKTSIPFKEPWPNRIKPCNDTRLMTWLRAV